MSSSRRSAAHHGRRSLTSRVSAARAAPPALVPRCGASGTRRRGRRLFARHPARRLPDHRNQRQIRPRERHDREPGGRAKHQDRGEAPLPSKAEPARQHEHQAPHEAAEHRNQRNPRFGCDRPGSPRTRSTSPQRSRQRHGGNDCGQMAGALLHQGDDNDDQDGKQDRHHSFSSHGNLMWSRTAVLKRALAAVDASPPQPVPSARDRATGRRSSGTRRRPFATKTKTANKRARGFVVRLDIRLHAMKTKSRRPSAAPTQALGHVAAARMRNEGVVAEVCALKRPAHDLADVDHAGEPPDARRTTNRPSWVGCPGAGYTHDTRSTCREGAPIGAGIPAPSRRLQEPRFIARCWSRQMNSHLGLPLHST